MSPSKHILTVHNASALETLSGGSNLEVPHRDLEKIYLVKSPPYDNEVIVTTTAYSTSDNMAATKSVTFYPINELNNMENVTHKDSFNSHQNDLEISSNSSQESSFEGFNSSPFGKLHHLYYIANQAQQNQQGNEKNSPVKNTNKLQTPEEKLSPGKMLFTKFYDTIIEENSCNAVDIQMSQTDVRKIHHRQSVESFNSNNSELNPSSELSFNGKIKSLNPTQTTSHSRQNQLERPVSFSASLMEASLNTSQQFSESFILKKYSNEKSPDLFGDDEDDEEEELKQENKQPNLKRIPERLAILHESQPAVMPCNLADNSFNCPTESSFANDDHTLDCSLPQSASGHSSGSYTQFKDNCWREREMLKRIRKCLAGVLPPPSVTIPQLDMVSAVLSRKEDIFGFFNDIKNIEPSKQSEPGDGGTSSSFSRSSSLFRPTHTLDETKNMPWRDILSVRQHGLYYNLNKASECNEYLSLSVMERFIGAETASSYMNSPSSAKKRNTRLKLLSQSPGNRLSHLAKRRAIFSSANLATQKTTSLVGPQILLDKRKVKNRRKATPKRMTPPSKKKNRKTPNLSANERLSGNEPIKTGPSRETSKRALFQSPAKHVQQRTIAPKPPAMKPELATRVEKSKRALLFTPEKQQQQQKNSQKSISSTLYFAPSGATSQLDTILKRKRNHCDDNDDVDTSELTSQSSKLFKTESSMNGLTPRALNIKSESFCIGAGSSTKHKRQTLFASNSSATNSNTSLYSSSSGSNSQLQMIRSSSVSSMLDLKMQRAYSDTMAPSNSLTENQKKKLLWAVSQALQERKITAKHESFKQYASILARVVRRIFQEFYQKSSTSNSETMLRLAKKYVYPVTVGSTADDIYLQAKTQIEDTKRQSATRLSGYIGPEEYQQLKQQQQSQTHKGSSNNFFAADSSFDSFGLISQTSSGFCGSTNGISVSQTSFLGQISQDFNITADSTQNSNSLSATKTTIQINTSLQNSSSKSNLCGVVLRENVDGEIRRSAQKNFTGKDQRNMSPYAGANNGSSAKAHVHLITDIAPNSAKARRQISFDS